MCLLLHLQASGDDDKRFDINTDPVSWFYQNQVCADKGAARIPWTGFTFMHSFIGRVTDSCLLHCSQIKSEEEFQKKKEQLRSEAKKRLDMVSLVCLQCASMQHAQALQADKMADKMVSSS
jgi:hypothetical protein